MIFYTSTAQKDMNPVQKDVASACQAQRFSPVPELWITGLSVQYPPYFLDREWLEGFAKRFVDIESPS